MTASVLANIIVCEFVRQRLPPVHRRICPRSLHHPQRHAVADSARRNRLRVVAVEGVDAPMMNIHRERHHLHWHAAKLIRCTVLAAAHRKLPDSGGRVEAKILEQAFVAPHHGRDRHRKPRPGHISPLVSRGACGLSVARRADRAIHATAPLVRLCLRLAGGARPRQWTHFPAKRVSKQQVASAIIQNRTHRP